jgi:signal transduction histidine kinase
VPLGRFRGGERGAAIPGVGLGLSATRSIVEAHGGTITVTSVLGRGSVFTIRLPSNVEPG